MATSRSQGGEPTKEEEHEGRVCLHRTPLSCETIASQKGRFSGVAAWNNVLFVGQGTQVRRIAANESEEVVLEVPGLVSMSVAEDDLWLLVRDKGRSWFERRSIDHPATVKARRDLDAKRPDVVPMGEGWYLVDAPHPISSDAIGFTDEPRVAWMDTSEGRLCFRRGYHSSGPRFDSGRWRRAVASRGIVAFHS